MHDPLVIHGDVGGFLTTWFRAALAARPEPVCQGVRVALTESDAPKQLIINDLGGADTSILTAERDVNLSILAGSKEDPKDANDLARIVHALRTQIPGIEPGNPISAVLESRGPFTVPENQPRARRLITVTFAIAGTSL